MRMTKQAWILVIAGVVTAAARRPAGAAPAAAAPGRGPIVVEAYDADRPADAAALLQPVVAELARRGYAVGDALAADVRARVSADPGALTASQTVQAQQAIDRGYQKFIDGEYEAALASVQQALAAYATAPGQLAREDALRTLERKALFIAARSAEVLGKNDDAFRYMAEEIRAFPDQRPSPAEFAPQVTDLYKRVKEELAKQGTGALEVHVDDDAAVVFVDERFVGTGGAKVAALPPGRYRVYVAKGERAGRVREIDVAPGAAQTMTVPWAIDGAIHTAAAYVGVESHGAGPDAELASAVQLGRALAAPRVIVLGVRQVGGRRAVVGWAIDVESQTKVFGAVQVEPMVPTPATMTSLAALLAGDKAAATDGIITVEPATEPEVAVASEPLGARRTLALGVGVVALAAGGAALGFELSSRSTYDASKREPDDAKQAALYDSANRKYQIAQGFAVGALACAVTATYLWLTYHPDERPSMTFLATPTPDGAAFAVAGHF